MQRAILLFLLERIASTRSDWRSDRRRSIFDPEEKRAESHRRQGAAGCAMLPSRPPRGTSLCRNNYLMAAK